MSITLTTPTGKPVGVVSVVWLCKKKIIKKDKTKTVLSVCLVTLVFAVCFGIPIYSMEKTKDIPYQTVSCSRYDIVKSHTTEVACFHTCFSGAWTR